MPDIDRNTGAIVSSLVRVMFYAVVIGITVHYQLKPSLKGKVSVVLLSLLHSFAYSVVYETCVRWEYCDIPINTFRVWASAVSVHFVFAWVLFLRSLDIYNESLLVALQQAKTQLAEINAKLVPPVHDAEVVGDGI